MLPGTSYLRQPEHRRGRRVQADARDLDARIDRLNHRVMDLPDKLHRDFYAILLNVAAAVPDEPGDRLDLGAGGPGDALRPGGPVPPLGALSRPAPATRRAAGRARGVRLQDRPEDRRRDAGAGRGVQRHDRAAQRDLRRPRTPGPGAEQAARPLRAAGGGRVPRRRGRPRDQQPAGLDRLLLRGPGEPRSRPLLERRRRRWPTPRSSATTCG